MPQPPDLYRVLQVIPEAEPEVIQAAYRALARKYHPDLGGSEAQMAMLNTAWETLRDEAERARYDQLRKEAAAQMTEAARYVVRPPTAASTPAAGSAPSHARSGTVLDFGRYAGFSIAELGRSDPDYLEWLARTPAGRRLQSEIESVLAVSRPGARSEPPRSYRSRRR